MHRTTLALGTLTLVALGTTGAAVAHAATATPTQTPSATASGGTAPAPTAKAARRRAPLHAEAVRRGKKGTFVTISRQRGTVTAVSPTSLTETSLDGFTRTYALTPDSTVRVDRKEATVADLKVGARAAIVATQTGGTWTVRRVSSRS